MAESLKFSEMINCPFCGSEEYYERMTVKGISFYHSRFDGEEAENTEMYDQLHFYGSGRAYCSECGRYLGNRETNTVGKTAEKVCRKNTGSGM